MSDIYNTYNPVYYAYFEFSVTLARRYATRDYFDSAGNYYKGTILDISPITKELSDITYGIEETHQVIVTLSNLDYGVDDSWEDIVAGEEIRGSSVRMRRILLEEDQSSPFLEFEGQIVSYILGDQVEITIEIKNEAELETLLPWDLVNADDWDSTALDLGQAVNICFGKCYGVPLRNIRNDVTSNIYDYLIGYGTIEGLWSDSGYGVKRDGVLVNSLEYTFYDGSQGSPYSGYAFLRFTKEQRGFSNEFYGLTADVKGLEMGGTSAQRNFALVIKNYLNNATWGLGRTVNAAQFTTASNDLNSIGNMYCDGAIVEQRKVKDVLNELAFPARASLTMNPYDGWGIIIDKTGSSTATYGEHDDYYDNCDVLSVSCIPSDEAMKSVTVQYAPVAADGSFVYENSTDVFINFGADQTYELPFVWEHDTAIKVLSYLRNRSIYSDKTVDIKIGMEARERAIGDIITLDASRRNITNKDYIVQKIERNLENFILYGREYSASIYDDVSIVAPSDIELPTVIVSGPAAEVADWIIATIDFTAGSGLRYFIDTSSGTIEMTMPASPATNDMVSWIDLSGNFGTYPFVISRNSLKIEGLNDDLTCNNNDESGSLVYTGTIDGWRLFD